MHNSGCILILIPIPGKFKSLIPVLIPIPARSPLIPFRFQFQPQNLDSGSDSDSSLSIPKIPDSDSKTKLSDSDSSSDSSTLWFFRFRLQPKLSTNRAPLPLVSSWWFPVQGNLSPTKKNYMFFFSHFSTLVCIKHLQSIEMQGNWGCLHDWDL